jgi:UDP-N-acetylmuramyl pentapeptide phosphotransferase/UDP-N-acetylglucosamine-1-phosphate transferase
MMQTHCQNEPLVKPSLTTKAGVAVTQMPLVEILPWSSVNMLLIFVWLLTATNGFNLIDGIDGLAGPQSLAEARKTTG